MIMSALKITALKMALVGLCSRMMFSGAIAGKVVINIAGMIAKYLATSFAMLNVVSEPRVMSICFPISTMSMSLVGLLSRSTIFPASRAACVPVFIATPTSACARAGASFVPSPVIATRCPFDCSSRMRFSFCSGVACAMKSSTPASAAMAAPAMSCAMRAEANASSCPGGIGCGLSSTSAALDARSTVTPYFGPIGWIASQIAGLILPMTVNSPTRFTAASSPEAH